MSTSTPIQMNKLPSQPSRSTIQSGMSANTGTPLFPQPAGPITPPQPNAAATNGYNAFEHEVQPSSDFSLSCAVFVFGLFWDPLSQALCLWCGKHISTPAGKFFSRVGTLFTRFGTWFAACFAHFVFFVLGRFVHGPSSPPLADEENMEWPPRRPPFLARSSPSLVHGFAGIVGALSVGVFCAGFFPSLLEGERQHHLGQSALCLLGFALFLALFSSGFAAIAGDRNGTRVALATLVVLMSRKKHEDTVPRYKSLRNVFLVRFTGRGF
ncbi:hypothetical protein B0T25DRAFT_598221 [Lasiosphaeria hispida]|uniref:Transmembrane protein n=1 Tax=Lasiosphaeria hispida TaxID=260671 RepID=A0AAJ0ML05_9PEZI|nr:hypothetical protein B0T25DRAFT_598221 [Lasiosphaeria hispida]